MNICIQNCSSSIPWVASDIAFWNSRRPATCPVRNPETRLPVVSCCWLLKCAWPVLPYLNETRSLIRLASPGVGWTFPRGPPVRLDPPPGTAGGGWFVCAPWGGAARGGVSRPGRRGAAVARCSVGSPGAAGSLSAGRQRAACGAVPTGVCVCARAGAPPVLWMVCRPGLCSRAVRGCDAMGGSTVNRADDRSQAPLKVGTRRTARR